MNRILLSVAAVVVLIVNTGTTWAQSEIDELDANPALVLNDEQWAAVDRAVDRALEYLSSQHRRDGSYPGPSNGQPAITAFGAMAFVANGVRPGEGPYGKQMEASIDYVLSTQSRTGFFSRQRAEPYIPRDLRGSGWDSNRAHAFYNHAIASLMLTEMFGMTDGPQQARMKVAIEKSLAITRKYQTAKVRDRDIGGWRYMFHNNNAEADLSVTAWQLMFLRSAKNAGFDVPKQHIADAMGYVHRCYDKDEERFIYAFTEKRHTRAMCGAGILSLSLGGEHNTVPAQAAADSLLGDSFSRYNYGGGYFRDQYHYSVYYATLGMFQIGGRHWKQFYPSVVRVLLKNQNRDGSWDPESGGESSFGNIHTTAMMVMVLTIADQMVPVYQR